MAAFDFDVESCFALPLVRFAACIGSSMISGVLHWVVCGFSGYQSMGLEILLAYQFVFILSCCFELMNFGSFGNICSDSELESRWKMQYYRVRSRFGTLFDPCLVLDLGQSSASNCWQKMFFSFDPDFELFFWRFFSDSSFLKSAFSNCFSPISLGRALWSSMAKAAHLEKELFHIHSSIPPTQWVWSWWQQYFAASSLYLLISL